MRVRILALAVALIMVTSCGGTAPVVPVAGTTPSAASSPTVSPTSGFSVTTSTQAARTTATTTTIENVTATATTVTSAPVGASDRSVETGTASRADTPPAGSLTGEADCLLSLIEVSDRLGGDWSMRVFPDDLLCAYENDRGAMLATIVIPVLAEDIDRELDVAREACSEPAEDVGGSPSAFLCQEISQDGDHFISGSVVAHGRLWLVSIPAYEDEQLRATQVDAMRALLTASLVHQ